MIEGSTEKGRPCFDLVARMAFKVGVAFSHEQLERRVSLIDNFTFAIARGVRVESYISDIARIGTVERLDYKIGIYLGILQKRLNGAPSLPRSLKLHVANNCGHYFGLTHCQQVCY
jgi:hypothetical protein